MTWRKSGEAATARKAINLFGSGAVAKTGLGSNSATAKLTFKPGQAGAGVYYVYYKFTTVGEDANTLIFKVTIQ